MGHTMASKLKVVVSLHIKLGAEPSTYICTSNISCMYWKIMEEIGKDGMISSTIVVNHSHTHTRNAMQHLFKQFVGWYKSTFDKGKLIWTTIMVIMV